MHSILRHLLPAGFLAIVGGCAPADDLPGQGQAVAPAAPEVLPTPAPVAPVVRKGPGERIRSAILHVRRRDLLTTNSFWTVFHGILGVGPDATLLDPSTGRRTNAIDHICSGGEIRGLNFFPTRHGLDVRMGPSYVGQGHQDQFIAEMTQWGMPLDCKFVVNGRDYTFEDFVRHAQAHASVKADQELSWAILILAQFRTTALTWRNERDERLTFDDVVRYELGQPIDSAACGGTHRLFGLTWAYHLHRQRGGKQTEVWEGVAAKTREQRDRARRYQNPDGSFSSLYLAGPGRTRDPQVRIGTTGHVLEWLALALSDAELKEAWVENAANALSLMILESADQAIESGALYHATHGLQIYHVRRYGSIDGVRVPAVPPHPGP
jgi:hypothetical protein